MEPVKKKKPPACDRCKAKRVLCHPDPSGCPRCKEKGVECTTTPVVRRKPQKRTAKPGPEPSPSAPPPPAGVKEQPDLADAEPVASTSQLPYAPAPSLPAHFAFSAKSDPNTALTVHTSAIARPPALPTMTPELVQHLFHCYEQTSLYDHAALKPLNVRGVFDSCGYDLSRLDPSRRVLAYAICALGSFMSFHPSIVGDEAPRPTSFTQIGTPTTGTDLRAFGRRRKGVCCALRDEAERMAKEADVAFDCSVQNAATAMIIDCLTCFARGEESPANRSRPWMAVYTSHLRELAANPTGTHETLDTFMWAIHLSADVISEIDSGRLSFSRADQLALTGTDPPDAAQLDKSLKETLQGDIDPKLWPDIRPLALVYLETARHITEKFLGTHARREPFNNDAFQSAFSGLDRLRSINTSFERIISRLDSQPTETVLFPHAIPKRARWTRTMALQGMRNLANFTWTSLVLPLYRELLRRERLEHDDAQAAEVKGEERSFEDRQTADRLALYLKQLREFVLIALESKVKALAQVPHLGTSATLRRIGFVDWTVVFIEELDRGVFIMNDKLAGIADSLAAVLKIAGYIYSDVEIDSLILRLESHALAFRLAQSTSSAGAPHIVPPQPFAFLEQGQGMSAEVQLFQQHLVAAGGSGSYPEVQQQPATTLPLPFASLMSLSTPSSQTSQDSPTGAATSPSAAQGATSAGLGAFAPSSAADLPIPVSLAGADALSAPFASVSSAGGSISSTSATPLELNGSDGAGAVPFPLFDATLGGFGGLETGAEGTGEVDLAAALGMAEWGVW
ncbi:hypothetical protein JCM10207_001586 [Rhodosporidiobolus poonsookiae]